MLDNKDPEKAQSDWKAVFAEQRARSFDVWRDPFVGLRAPKVFHLRRDPFERAGTDSSQYYQWWGLRAAFIAVPLKVAMGEVIETLKEYPPR